MAPKSEIESEKVLDSTCGSGGSLYDSMVKAHKRTRRKVEDASRKGLYSNGRSPLLRKRKVRKSYVKARHSKNCANYANKQSLTQFVDLRPIKEFLRSKMPGSPLAQALARKPDVISIAIFLELLPLFLQLGDLKNVALTNEVR